MDLERIWGHFPRKVKKEKRKEKRKEEKKFRTRESIINLASGNKVKLPSGAEFQKGMSGPLKTICEQIDDAVKSGDLTEKEAAEQKKKFFKAATWQPSVEKPVKIKGRSL